MLHEGKKIVFRVALALMKVTQNCILMSFFHRVLILVFFKQSVEKQLMALPFEGMMGLLRELPATANTEVVMEVVFLLTVKYYFSSASLNYFLLLMQMMWKIPLKAADVTDMEVQYVAANAPS